MIDACGSGRQWPYGLAADVHQERQPQHIVDSNKLQMVPSDTKLLLTKNYFEIIISRKITNFTRNFWKKSFFPGDFESANSLENYEK